MPRHIIAKVNQLVLRQRLTAYFAFLRSCFRLTLFGKLCSNKKRKRQVSDTQCPALPSAVNFVIR